MNILSTAQDIQSAIQKVRQNRPDCKVGFVPTMGALHAGHASLLKAARAENDFVVLSIFVNPTQFNNSEDLAKYPRTMDADLDIAKTSGVDLVWTPDYGDLYPDNYRYKVSENENSQILCGAFRPGHFDGVLTVVMKLLNVVAPTSAYFGEKDFQQLTLIQDMVRAFFMPMKIVAIATLRESDGLAMSSRNVRLSPGERQLAPEIYRTLSTIEDLEAARTHLETKGFRVEYLQDWRGRRLIAAWLGAVRLIDNVPFAFSKTTPQQRP